MEKIKPAAVKQLIWNDRSQTLRWQFHHPSQFPIHVIKTEYPASFQSSVSHDSSEIILICWFAAQETFLSIITVKSGCAA